MSIILCFILMLFLVFIINYGIHLYFKYKRKIFFKIINRNGCVEIKDIDAEIIEKSNFGRSCKYFKSDIIVYEGSFYLLLRNYNMDGLINQFKSIVQLSDDVNALQSNGVESLYYIQRVEVNKHRVKFYLEKSRILKTMFTLSLDFEDKPEKLDLIECFLKQLL